MSDSRTDALRQSPLHEVHVARGGKMVPFAGYEMPVQFAGIKPEHLWTRRSAGLFDVSHMGPCILSLNPANLSGDAAHTAISAIVERCVPSDIAALKPGQARLTVLLNSDGGILDDLIITRPDRAEDQGKLYIVVNGAVKAQDFHLLAGLEPDQAVLQPLDESHILIALQGPQSESVLRDHLGEGVALKFMRSEVSLSEGETKAISRCGYTGEDGFELLLPNAAGKRFVEAILDDPRVQPIGLGARDSLRLEAGLCLYGQDIDTTREPIEADLAWLIQKSRRLRGDFPGAARILAALQKGPKQKRVGIQPLERAPARQGTPIAVDGRTIGSITSGGFGPSVEKPIAMGYVDAEFAVPGTPVELQIRGKMRPAEICALPFVQPNYKR